MPGNITWEAEGSNDNGYVFGSVQGPNMIRTQFLYREGELLCCTTDEPFFLSAINDNNILVGGFATAPGPFIAYAGFDADKRKIPLNIIPDPRVPLNNWLLYGYTAIDSHNNILAKGPGQTFVLDPVFHPRMSQDRAAQGSSLSSDAVPEPGSLLLMLVGVVGLAAQKGSLRWLCHVRRIF